MAFEAQPSSPALAVIWGSLGASATELDQGKFLGVTAGGIALVLQPSVDGRAVLLGNLVEAAGVPRTAAREALDRLESVADLYDVAVNIQRAQIEHVYPREVGSPLGQAVLDLAPLDQWFRERGYAFNRDFGEIYMERPRASERELERERASRDAQAERSRGDESIPF